MNHDAVAAAIGRLPLADGLDLERLALHARLVREASERLHLTSIEDPEEFVRRHVAESLEGARAIPEDQQGALLDLGSGNGYPGVPLAFARPRLSVVLAESSRKKAEFLRDLLEALSLTRASILEAHVQRPGDLGEAGPFAVIACRAMGNWERVLPRLASVLAPGGRVLLWAASDIEAILKREVWRRYSLVESRPLEGLDRAALHVFERAP